jgi:simple sugar transport system permease protein
VAQATIATGSAPAAPAPSSGTERGRSASIVRLLIQRREATVFLVTVAVIVYFSIRNANFYSEANIITMVQYIAPIAVIGAGEVLLLVLAEIDLSAGQTFLTAPWIVYFIHTDGVPIGWSIAIALLCSLAIGAFNGVFTVVFGVPSLVVTLGTNYALAGFVLIASSAVQVDMPGRTGTFGQVFGISNWSEIAWALAIVVVIWVLLKKTRFGVHTTATGGNLLGAAEAGIPVKRVKVWCFMILAFGAAFVGILDGIRIGSLDPAAPGLDVVLSGIVAAVIGGTALTGGRGTVVGTLIGAVFLGVLEDGFNLIGVSANWFILAEGVVILVAMAINVQLGILAERTKR